MSTQNIPSISVEPRDRTGTRYARRLRQAGRLPAVIYGHNQEPTHVSVDRKQLIELLHHNAHLIEVTVNGDVQSCLIKDVQWDHLGANIVHVDLERVDLSETVTVTVDLVLVGDAKGLKTAGALLEHPVSEIEIRCTAANIPENIKVDVSDLDVNQKITVADLKLPEGVTTTEDPDTVIALVAVQSEEPEAEAVVEGAEPEVIRAKKEEESAD